VSDLILWVSKKAKIQKPNKSGKAKNGKRQRNKTQTVGSVTICVMFFAFRFSLLAVVWLLAFRFF
jgi:hypothetical protein